MHVFLKNLLLFVLLQEKTHRQGRNRCTISPNCDEDDHRKNGRVEKIACRASTKIQVSVGIILMKYLESFKMYCIIFKSIS
jgi:hypothetical protein